MGLLPTLFSRFPLDDDDHQSTPQPPPACLTNTCYNGKWLLFLELLYYKSFQRPWWAIYLHVFIYWSLPSFSRSLHQTDLLSLHRVWPPLCLTSLINRWPAWESGLRPCHSPVRLIGFHLSLQSKGSDYKQINRGVGAGSAGPPPCAPTLWQQRRLRVCESGRAGKKSTVWRPACLLLCCGKDDEGSGKHDWIIDFFFFMLSSAFEKARS